VQDVTNSLQMEPMAHKPEISTEPGPRGATGDNAALGDAVYVYELHRGHASVCDEARSRLGMPQDRGEASSQETPIGFQTTISLQSDTPDEVPDTEPSRSAENTKADSSSS
jgi:hypothetical protein